jgi:hypothetical protein
MAEATQRYSVAWVIIMTETPRYYMCACNCGVTFGGGDTYATNRTSMIIGFNYCPSEALVAYLSFISFIGCNCFFNFESCNYFGSKALAVVKGFINL